MGGLRGFIWCAVAGLFRFAGGSESRNPCAPPPAECAAPRTAETGNRRRCRSLGVCCYRLVALKILQPGTIIRWHRAGFPVFDAGSQDGMAAGQDPVGLCRLVLESPPVGRSGIHGELLKRGNRCRPDQGPKIHGEEKTRRKAGRPLFNRPDRIASIDLLLYRLLVLRHSRRKLSWLG